MAGMSPKDPCPSCGLPYCPNPWEVCEQSRIAADRAELATLRKQVAAFIAPDRGRMLNEHATLGSEIVRLLDSIPELEKKSKKTPPRTLVKEKAEVENAKVLLVQNKERLDKVVKERQALTETLNGLRAWGELPRGETPAHIQKEIGRILGHA